MSKKISIGLMTALFFYVLSPFLAALGMGAIFAVLFYPWMKRIDRGRFPNSLAAGLFTLAVTLLFFLPVSGLVVTGVRSGLNELRQIKRMSPAPSAPSSSEEVLDKMFTSVGLEGLLARSAKVVPIDPTQVSDQLKELIVNVATRVGDELSIFISHIPSKLVAFAVFLFSLFYFLADGPRLLELLRRRSIFNETETQKIFGSFSGLCRSVILASIISGGAQATLAMGVSIAVGINQFLMVFLIVFVASFIPVIGSFPVIISMAIYQLINGHTTAGIILGISSLVIATIDNFIRPQVIKGSSNLHPLVGFASALGGLEMFGVTGVFLGPVLCGLCLELIGTVYSDSLELRPNRG